MEENVETEEKAKEVIFLPKPMKMENMDVKAREKTRERQDEVIPSIFCRCIIKHEYCFGKVKNDYISC